jgi:hypothetical protein
LILPPVPSSQTSVTIDFQIDRRRVRLDRDRDIDLAEPVADEQDWEPAATHTATLTPRIDLSAAALLKPVSDPAMNNAVAQVVGGGAVKWDHGRSPVRFNITAQATFDPAFNDTAIGLRVELRHNGVVARRLNMWWLAGATLPANRMDDRNYGFEIDFEDIELLRQLNADQDGWEMHVQGDPALALRAGTAAKFWSGEVTVPLRLNLRTGDAPSRPWRLEE